MTNQPDPAAVPSSDLREEVRAQLKEAKRLTKLLREAAASLPETRPSSVGDRPLQPGAEDYKRGQAFMRERVAEVLRGQLLPDLAALVEKLPVLGDALMPAGAPEDHRVAAALADAARAVKHLTDIDREAERVDSDTMNFRLRSGAQPGAGSRVQALIAQWRADVDLEDTAYGYAEYSQALNRCADELEAALLPATQDDADPSGQ